MTTVSPPVAPVLPVLPVFPVAPVGPAGPGTGTTAGVLTTVGLSQAASVRVASAMSAAGRMMFFMGFSEQWIEKTAGSI